MKNKSLFLIIALIFVLSCKKKEKNKTLNDGFDTDGATLVSQSNFTSNAHTTSGCIKLYSKNGAKNLVFEGFKTDSGPDLRVYLSKSTNNNVFIEAGKLKATNGNFFYTVDGSINTIDYKYVLIWCEDYSVLFGNAQL
jgi:hypothetical protein